MAVNYVVTIFMSSNTFLYYFVCEGSTTLSDCSTDYLKFSTFLLFLDINLCCHSFLYIVIEYLEYFM